MSNDSNEPEYDVDAQFADIMSRWDATSPEPHGGRADTPHKGVNPAPQIRFDSDTDPGEDDSPQPPSPPDAEDSEDISDDPVDRTAVGEEGPGWRSYDVEDDDHFVPPAPRPLPAGDLQFWTILVGLVGGPALLIYLMIFNRDASGFWTIVATVLSLVGFGMLVARLPGRSGDDDGDDGARV